MVNNNLNVLFMNQFEELTKEELMGINGGSSSKSRETWINFWNGVSSLFEPGDDTGII